jgi:hypothetical protein
LGDDEVVSPELEGNEAIVKHSEKVKKKWRKLYCARMGCSNNSADLGLICKIAQRENTHLYYLFVVIVVS